MNEQDTFTTFAYGSNMLTSRLQARCPTAKAQGVAELHGHELRWHKRSRDGSGKCDVVKVEDPRAIAYGVLFAIARAEKADLDQAEGLGQGYDEKQIQVRQGDKLVAARVYVATKTEAGLKPCTCYHGLVVAGAEEHGLPSEYIDQLRSVAALKNEACKNHAANMKLLEGR